MTEQQDTDQDETEATDTAEAEQDAKSDDDDGDDDDKPSDKPDKPKKLKISYAAAMPRDEAVSYFEAIVGGLRSGRLEFKQDGESLILTPPDQLEIEVKAQAKGDKAKIVFEIEWSDRQALQISN